METNYILDLHKVGNKAVKEKLEKDYPQLFVKTTMLEDAIKYLTEKDEEVIKLRKLETLQGIDNLVAEQKIVVIFKHLNEKHIFDWKNYDETKYTIWWNMEDFSYYYFNYWNYYCYASARFVLKNLELVNKVKESQECISYFKEFMYQ